MKEAGKALGFDPFDNHQAPPASYDPGYREALCLLWKSLKPGLGRNTIKFSTVRTLRSAFTNILRTTEVQHGVVNTVMRDGKWAREMSSHSTDSLWFGRFMTGMKARMGETVSQDMALTPEVVLAVLDVYNREWVEAVAAGGDPTLLRRIAEGACFFIFTYAAGLRGFEVPKILLAPLKRHFVPAKDPIPAYIGVPMYGTFKSRGNLAGRVIVFIVQETRSGIQSGMWITRLIDSLARLGVSSGWLYQGTDGQPVPSNKFSASFYDKLEEVYESAPELFVAGVNIREDYGPMRSGRRGATTVALSELEGNQKKVDWFFRWNTKGTEVSNLPMHVLYAEKRLLVNLFLIVPGVL